MAWRRVGIIMETFHLRPVKSMKFTFDPFTTNVRSIRELLHMVHSPKVVATNDMVALRVDVKSNQCEPVVDVDFADGEKLLLKTKNLTTMEMLEKLTLFCNAKDIKREEITHINTKLEKKKPGKRKK
ncbi:hypothetical protein SNE40_021681 [Patella caerulea]|uniref:Large ribosomal subunit protein mL53 n=1 Tax=Patella caerulea TaxID=87958 RepID=A0AAN8IXZ5_PATCE